MKPIVAVADAHVHPWRLQSKDGGHDRLTDGLRALRASLDLAERLGAVWVFAGDMKQPKTFWPQSALTGVHAELRAAASSDRRVEMVMVAGNHDAWGEGGSGLAPFRDVATVVETASTVQTGAGPLVCAPWDADLAEVRKLGHAGATLVAHGFVQGCFLGPEDSRIAKGTPIEEYGKFSLAIFGDVHKSQARVPSDPKKGVTPYWFAVQPSVAYPYLPGTAVYCGSPYQQNWGERADLDKGALVVDLERRTYSRVPLGGPEYKLLELDEENFEEFMEAADQDDYDGNFVRVIYTGDGRGFDDFGALFAGARSVEMIVRRTSTTKRRADIHSGMSLADILRAYADAKTPPGDRDRAIEAGLRLVQ